MALDVVRKYILFCQTDAVGADLAAYFDTIPHGSRLQLAAVEHSGADE